MFEQHFLKFIKIFVISTVRFYGLWAYHRFHSRTTRAFFFVYSMIFAFGSLILFYFYFLNIFSNSTMALTTFAIHLLENIYLGLTAILYITLYAGINLKHKDIERLLVRARHIYETNAKTGVRHLHTTAIYLMKSIIFDLIYSVVLILGPHRHSTSPYANFFGAIIINLPPIVVRVVPNLYYGIITIGQLYYRNINNRIKILRSRLENEHPTVNCICGELNEISLDHLRLTQLLNECNELCCLQVVLYSLNIVLWILFEMILQFVLLKRQIVEGSDSYEDHYINLVTFAVTIYDFYTTFNVCDRIGHEVIYRNDRNKTRI